MSTGVATSATVGSSSPAMGAASDATVKNDCKVPTAELNSPVTPRCRQLPFYRSSFRVRKEPPPPLWY